MEIEESYWQQKANVKWLREGDENTKFFHQIVQNRKQRLHIHRIKNSEGAWITDPLEIQNEAISTFQSQLNGDHMLDNQDILELIPHLLSEAQHQMLTEFPSSDELFEIIKAMNGDSVPCTHGFNGFFYVHCW